jgi:putative IMPACT (imprinted ancient) family translation regulator
MLAVLRGADLGDVTVVVTRFFGGTLLGTGGLVRAYSDTTREVLAALPRAERIATRSLLVAIPYSAYTPVQQALADHQARTDDETFAADVTLVVTLPHSETEAFCATLATLTAGQADVQEITPG